MRDGHGLALGLARNPIKNYRREPLDLYALERKAGGIEPGEFALKRARTYETPLVGVIKVISWGCVGFTVLLVALVIGGVR